MAIIQFIKYSTPRNLLERRVFIALNIPLEGDWLNPEPDLNAGEYMCYNALKMAPGPNDQLKYSNPLKVIREQDSIYIVRTGISTGKEEKVCGYEKIKQSNSHKMAKSKKTLRDLIEPETADANIPVMTVQVNNVWLKDIYPSETNPRKSMDEGAIIDLAKSMHDFGLLQPITIRPDSMGKFEIVAGHRRFEAAKQLKWHSIPSIIREVSDDEILEIQIIENLQREDVSPMDEAAAFRTVLKRESIDWLCSRIHKSKKYITDRLKLNDLVEKAHQYVHKGILPLTHAIMISKLPQEEQAKCIDKCIEDDWNNDVEICTLTIAKLREFIEDDLMIDLDRACFDLEDAELIPAAGSCTACSKRTGNQNLLFQEITEEDKCTDPSCYHAKEKAHVESTLKKAKEDHGKGTVYTGKAGYSSSTINVKGIDIAYNEKPTKGKDQVCVVVTKAAGVLSSQKLGKKVWVDRETLEGKVNDKEKKTTSRSSRSELPWEERQKKEFTETVYPRLLKIASFLEGNNIPNAEAIAIGFLKDQFERETDRDVIALAVILGLYPIGGSAEILWNADHEIDWPDKIKIIEKLIQHIQGKGLAVICTVLALIAGIDDIDEVRTAKEIELEESVKLNWNELMELIEGKKKMKKNPK